MKLATFEVENDTGIERRVGVHRDGSLFDVTACYGAFLDDEGDSRPGELARSVTPPDMIEFLRSGERALEAARQGLDHVTENGSPSGPSGGRIRYPVDDVRLLSPLPRPNTIRDFITFEDHIGHFREEIPEEWYELPVYYKGDPGSVVHPGETVGWPSYTEEFDYELEVAAVVGRRGRDIPSSDAAEYIFGYTIFNDFSARDIQRKERVVGLGPAKAKDFANGFGPFLVTADEVDTGDARMEARVEGERWSEGNLGDMYHSFPELVEHASMDVTLYPGDVLGSGTVPTGCGPEVGKWVEPGDTIELEVEGIGTLTHRVGTPR